MYKDFDFDRMQNATIENIARIYGESLDFRDERDTKMINETYKKVRKILECPEMEKCHPYLYSLDMDDFNDDDTDKINRLYDIGINRGVLVPDETTDDSDDGCENDCDCEDDDRICGGPSDSLTGQPMNPQPVSRKPIYTVMYSATKDGCGTMGEFYSMAPTIEGAREDCMQQMGACGYNDIMIMAIDQTFPGVEDDYTNDYTDHSLDNVGPNYEEDGQIQEDDSEEFLKQETGDNSTEEEDDKGGEEKVDTEEETEDSQENGSNDEEESEDVNNETESETEEEEEEEESEGDENSDGDKQEEKEEGKEEKENATEDGKKVNNDGDGKTDEESEEKEEKTEDENGYDSEKDGDSEESKLTAEEKTAMKTLYTKTFKDVLKKIGNEKSVEEMKLKERIDFYEKLSEKWDKNDPSDFMTDDEQEKLNKIVVKKDQN